MFCLAKGETNESCTQVEEPAIEGCMLREQPAEAANEIACGNVEVTSLWYEIFKLPLLENYIENKLNY